MFENNQTYLFISKISKTWGQACVIGKKQYLSKYKNYFSIISKEIRESNKV